MGSLSTGGGTGAVAASAHAGCERYRNTDPMIVGRNRHKLAEHLGQPDTSAGIPTARWIRALTFERLVRHERFVSQLLTRAVGAVGLDRPAGVRRIDGKVSTDGTARALRDAHRYALDNNEATLITSLATPFPGMEHADGATPVKPDFAIVARRKDAPGTWLIMGDAKDYERIRSRIDDGRLLKGFLQVALGAESAAQWSRLPARMVVHRWGALAVPRNAFLQPEAVIEDLDDHREEVRVRAAERIAILERGITLDDTALTSYVEHLEATFDPATCTTCSLFNFCRAELRASASERDVLVEIGIRPERRAALAPVLTGAHPSSDVPRSLVANVEATVTGLAVCSGRRRYDLAGQPGTTNAVLAKADAAALGVHGLAVQRVRRDGAASPWAMHHFVNPQSPDTRAGVMEVIGAELRAAMDEFAAASDEFSLHLVLPDAPTGDLLVSCADSLAGVETSRIRWQRDLEMGRAVLTFNGEEAVVPPPLTPNQRLAVSFLLEEDRARAVTLRCPLVDLRGVLGSYLVAGGPSAESGRLDYLVEWAEATTPLDHRAVSDAIAASPHTPGARLANATSDAIVDAQRGKRGGGSPDLARYQSLVEAELEYKIDVVERTLRVLGAIPVSRLRDVYAAIERDAQAVWRRRLAMHASDLVRFSRTPPFWRNSQVELRDKDRGCEARLSALGDPQTAYDLALDAGTREVTLATVVAVDPVVVRLRSPRFGARQTIVALHVNGEPCVEAPTTKVSLLKGSFKFGEMSFGELFEVNGSSDLRWRLGVRRPLEVGDELVVADAKWFSVAANGKDVSFDRPPQDTQSAPRETCAPGSYAGNPDAHRWCCRSHESAEAEFADILAARRAKGELNPQVWPPVVDTDAFDTPAIDTPTGESSDDDAAVPDGFTADDLD